MRQVITLVGVAYIGAKAKKRDTSFGTKLTFAPGEVHQIEAFTANLMLQHVDVYAPENSPKHLAILEKLEKQQPVVVKPAPAKVNLTPEQVLDEQLNKLAAELKKLPQKKQLAAFEVTKKLGLELDLTKPKGELEQQIIEAYKVHVAQQLGVVLTPEPAAEPEKAPAPDKEPVQGEQQEQQDQQDKDAE